MNVWIQLLSNVPDQRVFDLLDFLESINKQVSFSWMNPSGKHQREISRLNFENRINEEKELFYEIECVSQVTEGGLEDVKGVFKISPNSSLWAKSELWRKVKSKTMLHYFHNVRQAERNTSHIGVTNFPSVLELTLKFTPQKNKVEIKDYLSGLFSSVSPQCLNSIYYGSIDIGNEMLFSEANSINPFVFKKSLYFYLAQYPGAIPYLDSQIDGEHWGYISSIQQNLFSLLLESGAQKIQEKVALLFLEDEHSQTQQLQNITIRRTSDITFEHLKKMRVIPP